MIINKLNMISNLFKSTTTRLTPSTLLFLTRPTQPTLYSQALMHFATNAQQRIYADRVTIRYPSTLGRNLVNGP